MVALRRRHVDAGAAQLLEMLLSVLGGEDMIGALTALEDWASVNDWIEYETRLNDVLPRYDDPVICTYDANLLNGSIAVDILRTHPVAIIGGLLYENPFFVPPQQILRQVLQRSGGPPKPYRG